jgi:phage gp37-like protein
VLIYAAIEDAIMARIKAASDSGALGYRLAEIASYGGEFDDETFFTSVRKFPAAWVTIGGAKPKPISARKTQYTVTIAVMVGTRIVRGERTTRHGTILEPGSYQLLDDVRRLLSGQSFGLAITPLRPGADRTLFNTKMGREARSVLAAEFATDYTFTNDDQEADLPDLERIGLHYLLKPGDDVEDANDLVELATT